MLDQELHSGLLSGCVAAATSVLVYIKYRLRLHGLWILPQGGKYNLRRRIRRLLLIGGGQLLHIRLWFIRIWRRPSELLTRIIIVLLNIEPTTFLLLRHTGCTSYSLVLGICVRVDGLPIGARDECALPHGMRLLMRGQIRTLGKSSVAFWERADVRLLARMRPEMRPQIEVEREAFAADVAFVRFFASMHQLMPLQLRVVEESLATTDDGADIRPFSVRDLVFSVRTLITKFFGAVIDWTSVPLVRSDPGLNSLRIPVSDHVQREFHQIRRLRLNLLN